MMNEKVADIEKDLEERKRTIDALTDSNTQLRAKVPLSPLSIILL